MRSNPKIMIKLVALLWWFKNCIAPNQRYRRLLHRFLGKPVRTMYLFKIRSSSLCSGNLHPDNVLRKERRFKTKKKAYYLELNQYHTDMIEDLKKWKEKWASCRDPEKLRRESTKLKQETLPISAENIKVATNSKKESPLRFCARNDDTAKYMSYIKVTLEAEITNKGALALYSRLGFIRAKRLFQYYLNGVDAFRLKLLFPRPNPIMLMTSNDIEYDNCGAHLQQEGCS